MAEAVRDKGSKGESKSAGYWRANTKLQTSLLIVWAVVGYVLSILLARPLNEIVILGFPLGFWFAQQGSIIVFVILIFIYARRMDRIDEAFGVYEEELGVARKRVGQRQGGDDEQPEEGGRRS